MMVVYFVVTLAATTFGAVAGMGGGVIIKPVLDLMGELDVVTISVLSSITVFCMALISTIRQINRGFEITKPMLAVTIGAIFGGSIGGIIFSIVKNYMLEQRVTVVQSVILLVILVFCLFYDKMPKTTIRSVGAQAVVGTFLGALGTFLGIGGGPINVALLYLLFGLSIRDAAKVSIFVILFAQAFGLIVKLISGQFLEVTDYRLLIVMIPAAIIGGRIGAELNIHLKEKQIRLLFLLLVIIVAGICIYNGLHNLL